MNYADHIFKGTDPSTSASSSFSQRLRFRTVNDDSNRTKLRAMPLRKSSCLMSVTP
ncbi:hypothetical protein BGX21_006608, partial [Mortierella sp. AD011]